MTCDHKTIAARAMVSDVDGFGQSLLVQAHCADCGWPFHFKHEIGVNNPPRPRISDDRSTLCAPIEPSVTIIEECHDHV